MRAVMATVLLNLILPESFKKKDLYAIKLEKYGSQVKRLNEKDVREGLGIVQHNDFLNSPCFYVNKEFSPSNDRLKDLSDEILGLRGVIQNVLFSFWLVKDNAIISDIALSKSKDGYVAFNRTPLMFSNSEGEFESVAFSNSELEECLKWFDYLIPNILVREEVDIESSRSMNSSLLFINSNKKFPYQDSNRLQRAIRFITIARADSFLPAKITFYISALESLLSISNVELKMQVADRTARIIGDSYEEKVSINKVVSIAYSFRSSYIHGAVNSSKTLRKTLRPYSSVEELSIEIDEVLRNLVKRFLTDLNFVAQMNDEDFNVWVSELLYN